VSDYESQEVACGGRGAIPKSFCDLLGRRECKARFTLLLFVLRHLMPDQAAVTCQAAVIFQPFKLGINVW
jgi:hypothetical protein